MVLLALYQSTVSMINVDELIEEQKTARENPQNQKLHPPVLQCSKNDGQNKPESLEKTKVNTRRTRT